MLLNASIYFKKKTCKVRIKTGLKYMYNHANNTVYNA